MGEEKFEDTLRQLLNQDLSVGTETFRDELLGRCLAVLDSENSVDSIFPDSSDLFDSDLELLAAAGDAASLEAVHPLGDDRPKG